MIAHHISLVNVTTNYCNNNILILDVKQLNEIMKLYYFYTLKALWDGQGKIKMYYGMLSRVKKQLSEKRFMDTLYIYHLVDLNLGIVIFFEKEEATEWGGVGLEIGGNTCYTI